RLARRGKANFRFAKCDSRLFVVPDRRKGHTKGLAVEETHGRGRRALWLHWRSHVADHGYLHERARRRRICVGSHFELAFTGYVECIRCNQPCGTIVWHRCGAEIDLRAHIYRCAGRNFRLARTPAGHSRTSLLAIWSAWCARLSFGRWMVVASYLQRARK